MLDTETIALLMIITSKTAVDVTIFAEHQTCDKQINPYSSSIDILCVLLVQKAKSILGCTTRSVASRMRQMILFLCSTLARPHMQCCVQLWSTQYKEDMNPLEWVQKGATKMMWGCTSPMTHWESWGCWSWRRPAREPIGACKIRGPVRKKRFFTRVNCDRTTGDLD